MAEPTRVGLDRAVVDRAAGLRQDTSLRSRIGGVFDRWREAWFGPGVPLPQSSPAGTPPRQLDYSFGYNYRITPRAGEGVSFQQLRSLSDAYDLARLAVETRKDQMSKIPWSIRPRDKKAKRADVEKDTRIESIEQFLRRPDQVNTWQTWLRMLLEDMLTIDAASLAIRKTIGGDLFALEPIDGATIRPVIDETGRRPMEGPQYLQIIKGMVAYEFQPGELLYLPRNVRTHRVYGYSPIEQIIVTVNIALRRQVHQLQYYTEGNIPEAFIGLPDKWTLQQVQEFQKAWDALMEGNTAARRHAKFVPGDLKIVETKEKPLKDEYDEWLARLVCYAFSLPPTAFVKQMNRAVAQTVQDVALEEGLMPLMVWVKDAMDLVITQYFNAPDLQFVWEDLKPPDPEVQARINDIYVKTAIKSVDEVREELGLDPIGMDYAIYTPQGPLFVEDILEGFTLPAGGAPPQIGPDGKPLPPGETAEPTPKFTTTSGVPIDGAVQDTALNGTQITSLLEIVRAVNGSELDIEGAVAMITVAYPTIDDAEARRILAGAEKRIADAKAEKERMAEQFANADPNADPNDPNADPNAPPKPGLAGKVPPKALAGKKPVPKPPVDDGGEEDADEDAGAGAEE